MTDHPQEPPHPLDIAEDDEGQRASRPPWSSGFSHPKLLKFSLYLLALSGGVLFLASVAAGNATYQSTLQQTAEAVYRVSMLVMLLAFGLILVAYRMPKLPESESIGQYLKQLIAWSPGRALVILNLLGLGLIWLVTLLADLWLNPWLSTTIIPLLVLLPALWITMIVVHRGFLQVYAIAALSSSVLMPMLLSLLGWRMLRSSPMLLSGEMGFAIYASMVVSNGLLCSGYAVLHAKSMVGDRRQSDNSRSRMLD